jgi:hypothetical protein
MNTAVPEAGRVLRIIQEICRTCTMLGSAGDWLEQGLEVALQKDMSGSTDSGT